MVDTLLLVEYALLGATPVIVLSPLIYRRYLKPRVEQLRVERARQELLKMGLTPQQYLASIPSTDVLARARAIERLGLEGFGKSPLDRRARLEMRGRARAPNSHGLDT